MAGLAVNVDHIATLRQSRGVSYPDPVAAAVLAELAGADGIVVHLRGDRRHIQDRDVRILRRVVQTKLILEMASTTEMLGIAVALIIIVTPLINWAINKATTVVKLDELRKMVDNIEEDKVETDICKITTGRIQADVCELKNDVKVTRETVTEIKTKLEVYFNGDK